MKGKWRIGGLEDWRTGVLFSSFTLVLLSLLLSACLGTQAPAPVSRYGNTPGEGSVGVHTVAQGDMLYKVAERYRLPARDIIALNGLRAPYRIVPGQRLRLPPPNTYRVRAGDSLSEVSRLFGVSRYEVARLNDLRPPYRIAAGQDLRLPSVAHAAQPRDGGGERGRPVTFVRELPPAPGAKPQPQSVPQAQGQWQAQGGQAQGGQGASAVLARHAALPATPPRSGGRFLWPVQGRILSGFGPKKDGLHNDGVNIAAPKGTPVRAAENGIVAYVGDEMEGYGNLVLIRHEDRWMSAYAHMDRILVARGAAVRKGETIGTVGSTGSVETPQLHFEIRRGAEPVDPQAHM